MNLLFFAKFLRVIGIIIGLFFLCISYICALSTGNTGLYWFEIIQALAFCMPLIIAWHRLRSPLAWWPMFIWLLVAAYYLAKIWAALFFSPFNDGSLADAGFIPGLVALVLFLQAPAVLILRFRNPLVQMAR